MRRAVVMMALGVMVGAVLPQPAPAGGSASSTLPAAIAATDTATEPIPFTLGGVPCTLIPVPTANSTPVGLESCPGVRPGGRLQTEMGLCTLNFLFRAPDGSRYIGTAGHCVIGSGPVGRSGGEKLWAAGTGPEALDSDGKRIGEFAYAVLQDPKDFALIRLDPGVDASPEMCFFGGPTGVFDTDTSDPLVLEYYGNGVGVGNVLPARSAVALGTPHPDHVYAAGLALPGDSGSGVMTNDGLAVGVLVTTGLHGFGINDKGVDFGTMGITRLGPQLARAVEVLGVPLEMLTAS